MGISSHIVDCFANHHIMAKFRFFLKRILWLFFGSFFGRHTYIFFDLRRRERELIFEFFYFFWSNQSLGFIFSTWLWSWIGFQSWLLVGFWRSDLFDRGIWRNHVSLSLFSHRNIWVQRRMRMIWRWLKILEIFLKVKLFGHYLFHLL